MEPHAPILVVDDERDMADLIQMKFRKSITNQEMSFLFAFNGQEALNILRQHPDISVVLADLNMPVMDGLTFLGRIHEESNIGQDFQFVKVIIVTAYNDMKNIRKAMNLGAVDFLTKPLDIEDLQITIQKTRTETGKLRELDWQRREELKKRLAAEEALKAVGEVTLHDILDRYIT